MHRRLSDTLFAWTYVVVCLAVLTGCTVMKASGGTTLDKNEVALIKPGVTTFSEVLAWFGPPDSIIDGTQTGLGPVHYPVEINNSFKATAAADLRAGRRPVIGVTKFEPIGVYTAPEGMVILSYGRGSASITVVAVPTPVGRADQSYGESHGEGFLIYNSKKDRTVVKTEGEP